MNQLFCLPDFIDGSVLGVKSVITVDDDLRIVRLNQNAESLFGYSENDLLGELLTVLLPDTIDINQKIFSECFVESDCTVPKSEKYNILQGRHSEGAVLHLKAGIYSVDYDGQRYYTVLIQDKLEDDTDPVVSASSLDTLTQLYIDTKENLVWPDKLIYGESRIKKLGIIEHNITNEFSHISDDAREILELKEKNTYGLQDVIHELVHPDDVELIEHIHNKSKETKTSYHIHHRLLMLDGRVKFVERKIYLFFDDTGLLTRKLELLKDITKDIVEEQHSNKTTEILRAVLDTTHICIAHLDRDMNFIFVNKAYADTDDKKPEYFVGKNHFELFPHEENEKIFRNVIATGEKHSVTAKPFEYEYNPERGVTHWDWTLTPIKEPNGYISGAVLTLLDVTERVQALSASVKNRFKLQKLNDRLEELVQERTTALENERTFTNTVLETQGALVMVLDKYGKVIIFNKACEEASGYSRDDILGKSFWDQLVDSDERDNNLRIFDELVTRAKPSQHESTWSTKNDSTRLIEWSNSTIRDKNDNSVEFVVMTGIDVTERRRTEEMLKRTSDNLDTAQRITKIGSWEYEVANDKLWWSEEYFRIFGFDPKSTTPDKELYLKHIHQDDIEKAISATSLLTTRGFKDVSLKIVTKNGEQRIIHEIARAEFDKNNNPVLLKGTVQDITDITKSEMERNNLQRQLQHAHKMESIGQLSGGIAHDFNNILAAILGFTKLASIKFAPSGEGTLAEYLQEIEQAGNRASTLVKQMLTFSRGDSEDLSKLDPVPVIKESVKMLRSTITTAINITLDLPQDQLFIETNALQLQQAIINLIVNARYALNGKGSININVAKLNTCTTECVSCHKLFTGEYLVISVKDTGGGIKEDIIPNIFQPFFTTKPVGEGTGMGLAMIHGFMHSSGGHIKLQIDPGKTTNMMLYFPLLNKEDEIISTVEKDIHIDEKNRSTNDRSILLVDDEESVLKFLCEYLAMNNYKVDCTTSSKEALEKFNAEPEKYNLLITDQSMPDLTGEELIAEIRKINPKLPAILDSGYSDIENQSDLDEDGLTYYLSKPLNYKKLLGIIGQLFEHKK